MWQVVSTSVSTTPASKSTPVKPSTSRTPASTPSTHATGSSHRYDNRYVQPSIIPLTILSAATVRVAGRISLFVEESARLMGFIHSRKRLQARILGRSTFPTQCSLKRIEGCQPARSVFNRSRSPYRKGRNSRSKWRRWVHQQIFLNSKKRC